MSDRLNEWLEEKEKEYKKYWNSLGKKIGYTGKKCINCNRNRVIKYSKGKRICDKCYFDQDKREYDYRYGEYL